NLQRNEKLVRSYSFSFESDKIYNMPYAPPYSLAIDSHYLDNWPVSLSSSSSSHSYSNFQL
ncbi:MAG: hypothetical protein WBP64_10810, partial [Nitrososphaeraceae archaeon]